ncbi:MAG TPA: hypothetical protein VGA21_13470 [Cyclobacteriaceae bacterium]|jgi:hypothetical protein
MKKYYVNGTLVLVLIVLFAGANKTADLFEGFETGTPEIKSMSSLTFGPEGILFIGDTRNAAVFAVETGDTSPGEAPQRINISNFDRLVAESLGTDVKNIDIQDMAVNPISKKLYFSVHTNDGSAVLLKLEGEKLAAVKLSDIRYSTTGLHNAPGEGEVDDRGRSKRIWSISDLNYFNDQVMITGISNQEFGSSFRSIPFPFQDSQSMSSLEIYHGNHGRYETNSPVRTFIPTEIKGEKYIVASYTCTPLVLFPLNELKPGKHVKGRTVGEFGYGNAPLDMIIMPKDGKNYLVMNNSNRPVMIIDMDKLASYEGALTEPVEYIAGVEHTTMPWVNVLQLDKVNDNQFVMLQRRSNGNLDLWSASPRW